MQANKRAHKFYLSERAVDALRRECGRTGYNMSVVLDLLILNSFQPGPPARDTDNLELNFRDSGQIT